MTQEELTTKLKDYCERLTADRAIHCEWMHYVFNFSVGKKYIKIYYGQQGQNELKYKSVFCFVDFDGNIYMPAGWDRPAKGIRATLDNAPLDAAQLYKRHY